MLEIYNETVLDLLNPASLGGGGGGMEVRQGVEGEVVVVGLTKRECLSLEVWKVAHVRERVCVCVTRVCVCVRESERSCEREYVWEQ